MGDWGDFTLLCARGPLWSEHPLPTREYFK
jgi:hypothetical protein